MNELREKAKKIKLFLCDVDGVLTDAGMYYGEAGEESKKFCTLDGGGFILLKMAGIQTGLITSEKTALVARRAGKLRLDWVIQGAKNKKKEFHRLLARTGIAARETAYIGDDINDMEMLAEAGISASVPGHCLPPEFSIDYVTGRRGGEGAVRDFAEWLLRMRGEYEKALALYLESLP